MQAIVNRRKWLWSVAIDRMSQPNWWMWSENFDWEISSRVELFPLGRVESIFAPPVWKFRSSFISPQFVLIRTEKFRRNSCATFLSFPACAESSMQWINYRKRKGEQSESCVTERKGKFPAAISEGKKIEKKAHTFSLLWKGTSDFQEWKKKKLSIRRVKKRKKEKKKFPHTKYLALFALSVMIISQLFRVSLQSHCERWKSCAN